MRNSSVILLMGLLVVLGCGRKATVRLTKGPRPQRPAELQPPQRPARKPHPLDQRVSLAFDRVPLPEVLGTIARETKVIVAVSPSIPVEEWSRHRVTLRMREVSLRAFLDWLVRPLHASYAVEEGPGAWLCRGDDLLADEPMELRSYRVPTHMVSRVPVGGALNYGREQAAVVDTLTACLRFLIERRPGCHLAFPGGTDLLAARLPARGHARLAALLDAMRYGSEAPESHRPWASELSARLRISFAWDSPPAPASQTLARIAEVAGVNLGWDPAVVGDREVAIPAGSHTLRDLLDAVVRKTPLARCEIEPGHGLWLYPKSQAADFPASGATPWDRAVVRAVDIRPLAASLTPDAILAHLRKHVDPDAWASGLPAAAVFVPTYRLIVVHDPEGQGRVATVVQDLIRRQEAAADPTLKGR